MAVLVGSRPGEGGPDRRWAGRRGRRPGLPPPPAERARRLVTARPSPEPRMWSVHTAPLLCQRGRQPPDRTRASRTDIGPRPGDRDKDAICPTGVHPTGSACGGVAMGRLVRTLITVIGALGLLAAFALPAAADEGGNLTDFSSMTPVTGSSS